MSEFYAGSYVLYPFVSLTGLSVDKLNFIVCQVVAAAIGHPFRKYFPSSAGTPNYHRYAFSGLIGTAICIFCFGHQIFHLLFQSLVCYLLMKFADPKFSRFIVCGFAILYLSVCHLLRQYYDYGGYTLDITGPLMISTQRLSALAFNVHDGLIVRTGSDKQKATLTERQRLHYVRELPNLLQFYTYILHYQGILVGPFIFYSDFQHFMEGTTPIPEGVSSRAQLQYQQGRERISAVIKWICFFGIVSLILPAAFPVEFLADEGYASYSLFRKWLYLTLACFVLRQRYYFAWSLGELGYLCSGFGFSGIGKNSRQPEYRLAQNFEFVHTEFGTSLKVCIDFWNISTVHWLRECIYERVPSRHATLAVFLASAAWHGFYPGYYLMFISLAGFTQVARLARRHVRPHFQQSETLQKAYDVATAIAAMTTLNCCAGAFTLLELSKSWAFWRSLYFIPHVIALAMYVGFTFLAPRRPNVQSKGAASEPSGRVEK